MNLYNFSGDAEEGQPPSNKIGRLEDFKHI